MSTSDLSKQYFCGIDIAKHKHQALILDAEGKTMRAAFLVTNNRAGFELLLRELKQVVGTVTVSLEATGHYWLALYEHLSQAGYRVLVFNPLQIHAYQKSGVRRCKNDRIAAFWIADFARIGHGRPAPANLPLLVQLREFSRFRYGLADQIGDCKRKLLCILDKVFPEYETLFSDVFLTSSRRLLSEAVTAQDFAEFDLSELSTLLQRTSRGRWDATAAQNKAEAIQTTARQSVGVGFLADAARMEVRCLLQQLELLQAQRDEIEAALETLMEQLPQHLTSIPGIGLVTGAALLSEIGDIKRFATVEALVAYAGIDATVHQSGDFVARETHMSKRGSPYLRRALWQAATSLLKTEGELATYYHKKRKEGKAHGTALGAMCRKLLGRVYVILKENRPYEKREVAS